MAYSDFTTLESALQAFDLAEREARLFADIPPFVMSDWLRETLARAVEVGLYSANEKARSEFIVAPILLEIASRNENRVALHSGKNLNVDAERGLNGECDFFLARSQPSRTIQAPIFALAEAKRGDIELGLGQCVAQMVGARLFNERKNISLPIMYGCVTSGEDWQFLQIVGDDVMIDNARYYLNQVEQILAVLQNIVDSDSPQPKG
jgi:hypothetical protein